MAVAQLEVNIWTQSWQRRFHKFGGHVCTTLMTGDWVDGTPLHDAALQGRLLPLRRLLSQGYNVDMTTLNGITALHEACAGGHFICAKLLLDHGADPNAVSIDGATPLFGACCSGNPALVSLILMHTTIDHPAHLLNSPLHEAAKRGHTVCVELLLSHGLNVDLEVPNTGTALYCACESKSTDCVQSLLISGADVQCGHGLDTPLHAACRVAGAKEVELLLEHGADRSLRNSDAKYPLDLTTDQNIKHLLQTPGTCTLSQLCRWSIRRSLGQKGLNQTKVLCLPQMLQNYLLFL